MTAVAEPGTATEFLPVSPHALVSEECVGVPLYLPAAGGSGMTLYCAADVPFEAKDRRRLIENAVPFLYIRNADQEVFQDFLRDHLTAILSDETVPVLARFSTLNDVVCSALERTFQIGCTDDAVRQSNELAGECVDMLVRDEIVVRDLIRVMYHDYHTFTHSTNVSYYCVLLANALGITDRATLKKITVGGFLHDLGKLEIPEWILQKPERLTEQEFEIIQDHPRIGFLKLCHRADLEAGQLMMAYHHHERVDGGGYPVGCSRLELHEWARICKVADVFEALTSDRPYRSGLAMMDVFEMMEDGSGRVFDKDMLQCWRSIIGNASSGS